MIRARSNALLVVTTYLVQATAAMSTTNKPISSAIQIFDPSLKCASWSTFCRSVASENGPSVQHLGQCFRSRCVVWMYAHTDSGGKTHLHFGQITLALIS